MNHAGGVSVFISIGLKIAGYIFKNLLHDSFQKYEKRRKNSLILSGMKRRRMILKRCKLKFVILYMLFDGNVKEFLTEYD